MTIDGERASVVVPPDLRSRFTRATWSPDGRRIAYARHAQTATGIQAVIETRRLDGSGKTVAFSGPVHDLIWARDGRVLFSRPAPVPKGRFADLWAIRVDPATGRPQTGAARITDAPDVTFRRPSQTADGDRLVFMVNRLRLDVYAAAFDPERQELRELQPGLFSNADNMPSAWTPRGDAILFQSDRAGYAAIYRQPLGARDAEEFLPGSKGIWQALYSPDTNWILFLSLGHAAVMRAPAAGGAPEELFAFKTSVETVALRCARAPADVCVARRVGDRPLASHRLRAGAWEPDGLPGTASAPFTGELGSLTRRHGDREPRWGTGASSPGASGLAFPPGLVSRIGRVARRRVSGVVRRWTRMDRDEGRRGAGRRGSVRRSAGPFESPVDEHLSAAREANRVARRAPNRLSERDAGASPCLVRTSLFWMAR